MRVFIFLVRTQGTDWYHLSVFSIGKYPSIVQNKEESFYFVKYQTYILSRVLITSKFSLMLRILDVFVSLDEIYLVFT